jgi:hypothetical protein
MVGKKLVLCEVIMHGAIVVDGSESVSRVCPRLDLPIHPHHFELGCLKDSALNQRMFIQIDSNNLHWPTIADCSGTMVQSS